MKFQFTSGALAKLREAVDYYNKAKERLGAEFSVEVDRAVERIVQTPNA